MNTKESIISGTKKRITYFLAITIIFIAFIILFGPLDFFKHGYFCDDEISVDILTLNSEGFIDLGQDVYESSFEPLNNHFAGFELLLMNHPSGNTGFLYLEIYDSTDKKNIDEIVIDLSKVTENKWYKVHVNKSLKKNTEYILRIKAKDCNTFPALLLVDSNYLPEESINGNVAIGYAYAHSTFSFNEKCLLISFALVLWAILISFVTVKFRNDLRVGSAFLLLTTVLTWNYMYNSMDNQNTTFSEFQDDSETLVTGGIVAEHYGLWNSKGYGLGRYSDIHGDLMSYSSSEFVTVGDWSNGYNLVRAGIAITTGYYSRKVAMVGNTALFSNGERYIISEVDIRDDYTLIYFDSDEVLSFDKNGNIEDICFFDAEGRAIDKGILMTYGAQFGLQGKVFRHIARYLNYEQVIDYLHLLCSFATALIFVLLVFILKEKYNCLLASVFLITFWVSPWIVNFARNLYWVEFTWFMPMLVGLFCAWKINNRKYRILSYLGAFLTIAIKSLCGYEYISVIMMGLVSFLIIDFISAAFRRDKKAVKLIFRTTLVLGIAALAGFVLAICIHAKIKGNGNILNGIKIIFENDVLRRTYGVDLNVYTPKDIREAAALTASAWEVFCLYFHFPTEIITGIRGNLFPFLCIIPIILFLYDFKKKKIDIEQIAMYVVFFITTVTWYILAKSHSYVHLHMNYVLWYFGFIQTCFYIILSRLVKKQL